MGFRGKVSRNTLAHANENRDWRIYADLAQILIRQARLLYSQDEFGLELEQVVYALDSTTIDLCLSLVPVGSLDAQQGRCEIAYVAGSARQYSYSYRDHR